MTKGKYKIENKKRFIIAVTVLLAIIVMAFVIIITALNKDFIPNNNNVTQVMFNKKKIRNLYNNKKEEFKNTHKEMQEKISMWLLSNITKEKGSFEKNVEEVNKYLEKGEYEKFSLDKAKIDYWIGEFKLDKTGKLTFKFSNKGILPSWIKDDDIKDIVL